VIQASGFWHSDKRSQPDHGAPPTEKHGRERKKPVAAAEISDVSKAHFLCRCSQLVRFVELLGAVDVKDGDNKSRDEAQAAQRRSYPPA